MSLWTCQDVADVVGGRSLGSPWCADGVSFDTRTLESGDLFVALPGARTCGERFVQDALAKGACAALVSEESSLSLPQMVVPDTFEALKALARRARQRSKARIVAITGSAGKTGIKNMLAHILPSVYATYKSYNGELGTPLCLSRLPQEISYGVFEIGMDRAGQIEKYVHMIQPHMAVITNVYNIHPRHFQGERDIAVEKSHIIDGLPLGGTVVLPRDNQWFDFLFQKARNFGASVLTFGTHEDSDARLLSSTITSQGSKVVATWKGASFSYSLSDIGEEWCVNSLAAVCVLEHLGFQASSLMPLLADRSFVEEGHGKSLSLPFRGGHLTLIDDTHSANPFSMRAALKRLGLLRHICQGRLIAILGDMKGYKDQSDDEHRALAQPILTHHIDLVITMGQRMKCLYDQLPSALRGGHGPTLDATKKLAIHTLQPGDYVLVKGSLSNGLRQVIDALSLESD